MATLALSVAGQFAGGLVGGPFGATIGRALGALAGSAIDNAIFSEEKEVVLPSPFRLQGSQEGGAIPKIYGWNRVTGNIIWATNLERHTVETAGSKGTSNNEQTDQILANFAIGLCEGEVALLGRIWADGRLLETEGLNIRFYRGTQTQAMDSLISAKQGSGNTPAYRGLCYLVFEGLVLEEFGNRIPNISVELCRVVGDLEPSIRAITVIPGATEFGYDPTPRVRIISPGKTVGENTNMLGQTSDWTLSIDQLQALCPNLKHVALVVAWFGDDLRCGSCKIQPRVEGAQKTVSDTVWIVSGNGSSTVPVMTQYKGGPAYGGTPSDSAVLAAIADLKSRGIKVTLYPFVLMDIGQNNALSNPYTGAVGQSAYPWRGRITCNPAPGEAGSPDKSGSVNSQVNAFVGSASISNFSNGANTINYIGATDWGYRRMVLHYAKLAALAGGVDAMLIGSEMRGMTWLRNSAASFPYVDALVTLAADVRTIVGPTTKLSYGADWSEYAGLQPVDAPGDKIFHLDSLWANSAIDAVGIDNYMPLADWRGDGNEPDVAIADHAHQLNYLSSNIAGGEGFDWYYASNADRKAGVRSAISDGTHAEPWIWRFKDIKSWWSNAHHNRINGIRSATSTNWLPQSKPIWLTEFGCGAVDKGANQPNVFGDEKSVESAKPYFSDGSSDAVIQRQFLRAHHRFWQSGSPEYDPANNPNSNVYAGQMLDPDRLYTWTWDARPFPAFPNRLDVWSDGVNHATGHWVTGRLGGMGVDEYLRQIALDYGVSFSHVDAAELFVHGVQILDISSLRKAIDPCLLASGLMVRDQPDGICIFNPASAANISMNNDALAAIDGPILSRQTPNVGEEPGQLSLAYVDRMADYQLANVTAITSLNPMTASTATNVVLDASNARNSVEKILHSKQSVASLELALPKSKMAMEVGDQIQLSDLGDKRYVVSEIRVGDVMKLSSVEKKETAQTSFQADQKLSAIQLPQISTLPEIFSAQVVGTGGDVDGSKLIVAAFADPWPGSVSLTNSIGGALVSQLASPAIMGELTADLLPAISVLWDRKSQLMLNMFRGHLSSVSELEVLNGANRIAILKNDGQCEIVGFMDAELIGVGQYKLSNLLRGQSNSFEASAVLADSGNRALLLNDAVDYLPIQNAQLGLDLDIVAYAGASDLEGQTFSYSISEELAKPLAPTHLSAKKIDASNDIKISWQRRSQVGGDSWAGVDIPLDFAPETYAVHIFDGVSLVREIIVTTNSWTYEAADQIADLGSALASFDFTISQVSTVHGTGKNTAASFIA